MSATPPTIRHESLEANGVRLHLALAGDPDDPLILFLHGFPEFWYAWRRQLHEFGVDHLAAAPDQRGYARSSKPEEIEEYRIERLAGDALAIADRFGKERFVVVGHDWGGIVAWSLGAFVPERVERLVIVNAPHPAIFRRELAENPDQRKASEYMTVFQYAEAEEALSADGFAALEGSILEEGIEAGWFTEEDREAYLEAWSRPGALSGMLAWYRAAGIHPGAPPESLDEGEARDWTVPVPTLVIWGEQDRYLLPGNLVGLEELVPDLEIRRVPDTGHWIVHQKPDLVNEAIRGFLEH
ncbi:MAG: alpha/beta hydrolase [Gemmatimonadota bacterium]|nr:alpha/beta hydrolase [Gemmatimonadota bacterium]